MLNINEFQQTNTNLTHHADKNKRQTNEDNDEPHFQEIPQK